MGLGELLWNIVFDWNVFSFEGKRKAKSERFVAGHAKEMEAGGGDDDEEDADDANEELEEAKEELDKAKEELDEEESDEAEEEEKDAEAEAKASPGADSGEDANAPTDYDDEALASWAKKPFVILGGGIFGGGQREAPNLKEWVEEGRGIVLGAVQYAIETSKLSAIKSVVTSNPTSKLSAVVFQATSAVKKGGDDGELKDAFKEGVRGQLTDARSLAAKFDAHGMIKSMVDELGELKDKLDKPINLLDKACNGLQLLTGRIDPNALPLAAAQDQIKRAQARIKVVLVKAENELKKPLETFSNCIAPPPLPPSNGSNKTEESALSLEQALSLLVSAANERNNHSLDELLKNLKDKEDPAGVSSVNAEIRKTDDAELRRAYELVEDFCSAVRLANNSEAIVDKFAVQLRKELDQWATVVLSLKGTVKKARESSSLRQRLSADEHATALTNIFEEVANLLDKLDGSSPNQLELSHHPCVFRLSSPEHLLLVELADGVLGDSDDAKVKLLRQGGAIDMIITKKLVSATTAPEESFYCEVSDAKVALSKKFRGLRATADTKVMQRLTNTLTLAAALSKHAAQHLWKAVLEPHLKGAKTKQAEQVVHLLDDTAKRFLLAKQGLEKLLDDITPSPAPRDALQDRLNKLADKADLLSSVNVFDNAIIKVDSARNNAELSDALKMVADLNLGMVDFGKSLSGECKAFSRSVKAIIKSIEKKKPVNKTQGGALDAPGGGGGVALPPPATTNNDDEGPDLVLPKTVKLFGMAGVMMLIWRKMELLANTLNKGRVMPWLSAFAQFISTLGLAGWPLTGLLAPRQQPSANVWILIFTLTGLPINLQKAYAQFVDLGINLNRARERLKDILEAIGASGALADRYIALHDEAPAFPKIGKFEALYALHTALFSAPLVTRAASVLPISCFGDDKLRDALQKLRSALVMTNGFGDSLLDEEISRENMKETWNNLDEGEVCKLLVDVDKALQVALQPKRWCGDKAAAAASDKKAGHTGTDDAVQSNNVPKWSRIELIVEGTYAELKLEFELEIYVFLKSLFPLFQMEYAWAVPELTSVVHDETLPVAGHVPQAWSQACASSPTANADDAETKDVEAQHGGRSTPDGGGRPGATEGSGGDGALHYPGRPLIAVSLFFAGFFTWWRYLLQRKMVTDLNIEATSVANRVKAEKRAAKSIDAGAAVVSNEELTAKDLDKVSKPKAVFATKRTQSESEVEFKERVLEAVHAGNAVIIDEGCYVKVVSVSLSPSPSCELEKIGPFDESISRAFLNKFSDKIGQEATEEEAIIASVEASFMAEVTCGL